MNATSTVGADHTASGYLNVCRSSTGQKPLRDRRNAAWHETNHAEADLFAPGAETATRGWVVEALIPTIGAKQCMQRLFVVAADDQQVAEKLVFTARFARVCRDTARTGQLAGC
jgi:hypothetical protein